MDGNGRLYVSDYVGTIHRVDGDEVRQLPTLLPMPGGVPACLDWASKPRFFASKPR